MPTKQDILENSILSDIQKKFIIKWVDVDNSFFLTGGTAIAAFFCKHRISEDLDFFKNESFSLMPTRKFLLSIGTIKSETKKHDRNIFILEMEKQELKLEFSFYEFPLSGKKDYL